MNRTHKIALGLVTAVGAVAVAAASYASTITRPYYDYAVNPGDAIVDVIRIYNEEPVTLTLYPSVENFTGQSDTDSNGAPQYYPADEDPYGMAMAKWVTFDQSKIVVEPGQKANLTFTINVPRDASPGGHYGAVILSGNPPNVQGGGAVGLQTQIGSLLLLRVSGDVVERGGVAEFGFRNPKPWHNYLPIEFFARFENSGNVHLRPSGNLFITNWYGRQVASIQINSDFRAVLPRSIRRFEFDWMKSQNGDNWSELRKEWTNFGFGKYTANLVLSYGSDNKLVSQQIVFYVWPWRIMSIVAAFVLILILGMTVGKKAYDRALFKRFENMKKE